MTAYPLRKEERERGLETEAVEERRIKLSSSSLRWFGAVSFIVGVFLIALPLFSTLAVELVIAASVLVIGCVQVFHSFSKPRKGQKALSFAAGAAYAVIGLYFILNPVAGAFVLTIVLAVLFLLDRDLGSIAKIINSSRSMTGIARS